jgi:pyruvate-formate lyase-activating enzyme
MEIKKYFPIKTATACQLKWSWSTLFLWQGITRSCHRTADSELTSENFLDFHNTDIKIQDRQAMLDGQWPEKNCSYCKNIENQGGISDRIAMTSIPNLSPDILYEDPTATIVDPSIVEVYFNNTCNLGCLYCNIGFSSVNEDENRRFGSFQQGGVRLIPKPAGQYKNLVPHFWQWFERDFQKIKRLHILGGEPFLQKELFTLLDKFEQFPNPNCEFNIVTNLMCSEDVLEKFIDRCKTLLINQSLKRVDITCSIDGWGADQEHVRWGLNLDQWEKNFKILLKYKWLRININQTITVLTIKTMPELLKKLKSWQEIHPVGHFFSEGNPLIECLEIDLLGYEVFRKDIEQILECMPESNNEEILSKKYMSGILSKIKNTSPDLRRMQDLKTFLDEKDRRRGTNWQQVFPWISEEFKKCGIVE